MTKMLGELETRFFGYVQMRRLNVVRTGDLVDPLGLTPIQERKMLSRLSKAGLIARVRRGLYLVPARLPAGGKWSPGEFLTLKTLIEDRRGTYQICGPNAFYRYGWDRQVPNRVFAYNNCISGERQIGPVALTLVKVSGERLGGTDVIRTPDGIEVAFSSKPRSLMDAVYDWSRFNSLPRAYDWIRTELRRDLKLPTELVKVTLQYGNQGTLRRVGKMLELQAAPESLLRKLEKALRSSSSLIKFVPTLPKRGKIDRRWGLVLNG